MNQDSTKIANPDEELVHVWHHCHNCGSGPIRGLRYHCQSCPAGPDNDLCEKCREKLQKGEIKHPAEYSHGANIKIVAHHFEVLQGKPVSIYEKWLQVSHPETPGPQVADFFVVRPLFCFGNDAAMASYAFVVDLPGQSRPLLLTALHVLDEIIKKKGIDCSNNNKNYSGKELPAIISEVNIYDVFADKWMLSGLGAAAPMLVLPGAGTGDEEPYSDRDIAAFWVKEKDISGLNPAPLAGRTPEVGEPVWLAAKLEEQPAQRTLKAVVVEKTARSLVFKYEDLEAEKPNYSSGAPILDKNGEVVGINAGWGRIADQKVGHANHVENIRRHLSEFISR